MTTGQSNKVPRHVAIIMDGNGRWAQQRGLGRVRGHRQGVETVKRIARTARDMGIEYLTLFSFSTENWSRPRDEVSELFALLKLFVRRDLAELHHNNCRVKVIGDRSGLPDDIPPLLTEAERLTANNDGQTLVIAFNYGARAEISAAARELALKFASGDIALDDITPESLENHLQTAGIPDPDLVIRTSGECRLSNFLLWQCAYSEFVFEDKLWPDFTPEDFSAAVEKFASRDRRFGGLNDTAPRETGS